MRGILHQFFKFAAWRQKKWNVYHPVQWDLQVGKVGVKTRITTQTSNRQLCTLPPQLQEGWRLLLSLDKYINLNLFSHVVLIL